MKFSVLLFSIVSIWALGRNAPLSETVLRDNHPSKNQDSLKDRAFTVLRAKCNVCHATKKRTDIFTLENMDSLAIEIHKQVFVKKKMPKGRKVKLTQEEQIALEKWVTAVMDIKRSNE